MKTGTVTVGGIFMAILLNLLVWVPVLIVGGLVWRWLLGAPDREGGLSKARRRIAQAQEKRARKQAAKQGYIEASEAKA